MPSYHCSIKIVSRAAGRSAVAAAAYRSCSRIECERDGIVHDYTRKGGLVDAFVVLPKNAPERFSDRSTLWNEVERVERGPSAQLAREFEIALPHELTPRERIALVREFCEARAAEGMICDAAIHDPGGDGHNVHAHIMCPMRECGPDGLLPKSENAYTVRKPSDRALWAEGADVAKREKALEEANEKASAAEFKALKGDGYEKVYKYRRGNEWRQLTPTEAGYEENAGFKRHGKAPVQETRYINSWNDKANAERWRSQWADMQNAALERAGSAARVDHRSYERRGIERIAQRHEGPYVSMLEREAEARAEREGVAYEPVTDRRRENAAVAIANRVLDALRDRVDALGRKIADLSGRAEAWWSRKTDQVTRRREAYIARNRGIMMATAARKRDMSYVMGIGSRVADAVRSVFAHRSPNHFNDLADALEARGIEMDYAPGGADLVFSTGSGRAVRGSELAGASLDELRSRSLAVNGRVDAAELSARAREAMASLRPRGDDEAPDTNRKREIWIDVDTSRGRGIGR